MEPFSRVHSLSFVCFLFFVVEASGIVSLARAGVCDAAFTQRSAPFGCVLDHCFQCAAGTLGARAPGGKRRILVSCVREGSRGSLIPAQPTPRLWKSKGTSLTLT